MCRRATQRAPVAAPARLAVALAALITLVATARAQQTESAAKPGGHGWVVVPQKSGDGASLYHLPPRIGADGAPYGSIRLVNTFDGAPQTYAGWGKRVFIVLKPSSEPGGRQRRVLMVEAVANPNGAWTYSPPDRPAALPSLPGEGRLIALAAGESGPAALMRDPLKAESEPDPKADASQADGRWRLSVLLENKWRAVKLPWEDGSAPAPTTKSRCFLAGTSNGLVLLDVDEAAERATCWTTELPKDASDEAGEAKASWTSRAISLAPVRPSWPGATSPPVLHDAAWVDGYLIGVATEGGDNLSLLDLTRSDAVRIAGGIAAASPFQVVPMPGAEQVALLWTASTPKGQSKAPPPPYHLTELSTIGTVWYDGDASRQMPISAGDVQTLALILGLLAITVMLFVFRPDPDQRMEAPASVVLAEPWRRLVAAAIDFTISSLIVSLVMGRGATGFMEAYLGAGGGGGTAVWAMALPALAVSFVHCTAGEWLFGRTIGKALLRCEVISTRPGAPQGQSVGRIGRGPGLRDAAIRNLIKWTMPVLTVFLLADAYRRHPGDLLASTIVVLNERAASRKSED